MNRTKLFRFDWLLFLVWALFVNACNLWLVEPIVEDYSILGVIGLFLIIVIWIWSTPARWRKKWITFTVFSILLGSGLDSLTFFPTGHKLEWMVIMSLAMIIAAVAYARIRLLSLVLGAAVLVVANLWLPMEDWSFLTHFRVVYYGKAGLNPADMPDLPMVPVDEANGTKVLVTLSSLPETKQDVKDSVDQAGATPNDLHNVIQSFNHRYQVVEVRKQNGKFIMSNVRPGDIAKLDPRDLFSPFFPMRIANWTTEQGQILEYTIPTLSPRDLTQVTNDAGNYPANLLGMAENVRTQDITHWNAMLSSLSVKRQTTLSVHDGALQGTWQGRDINVPVDSTELIATGSFTRPGADEALLEGANRLQVVDLARGTGRLLSTYVGSSSNPLTNDIRVGAIDQTGQDMIFVNNAPAFILKAASSGNWQTLYTAPSESSLRFEGSYAFGSDKTPEIITNDPSLFQPTTVRYLTSYTYRSGQLYRNWRVYHTNVVNVHFVRFTPNGPMNLVASLYDQGKFFILQRHFIPVVPITSGLLGLSVLIGFLLKLRKGDRHRAHA